MVETLGVPTEVPHLGGSGVETLTGYRGVVGGRTLSLLSRTSQTSTTATVKALFDTSTDTGDRSQVSEATETTPSHLSVADMGVVIDTGVRAKSDRDLRKRDPIQSGVNSCVVRTVRPRRGPLYHVPGKTPVSLEYGTL